MTDTEHPGADVTPQPDPSKFYDPEIDGPYTPNGGSK